MVSVVRDNHVQRSKGAASRQVPRLVSARDRARHGYPHPRQDQTCPLHLPPLRRTMPGARPCRRTVFNLKLGRFQHAVSIRNARAWRDVDVDDSSAQARLLLEQSAL